MLSTSIMLATLASLLMLGNASPLPQSEEAPEEAIPEEEESTGGRQIRWLRESDGAELCLQVDAITGPPEVQLKNGGAVTFGNCFTEDNPNFPFQQWVYNTGSTKICVAPNAYSDTDYCIDFGTNLGSNGQTLYIWQAYEGLPAQQLYITDDNHIAVENGPGQCVDVRAESGPQPSYARAYGSEKSVQAWDCTFGNTNQIFIFNDAPTPPVPTVGRPITWTRESDGAELCLQVNSITGPQEVQLRNGASLGINECFPETSPNVPFQRWEYTLGSTKICVAPNAYSDAYEGLPAQQLYITDDKHIAVENGPGQCVDVRAESGPQPSYARPYGSQKDVQSWQCTAGNANQIGLLRGNASDYTISQGQWPLPTSWTKSLSQPAF
ncbi:hypothetical protein QFC20_003671 [Naganishia adeliensis]|uniref:Uncharacterized protein n=1 Tax=Naganishia adeliensis TaxID=92952 RepID=A0ACC2WAA7_9TREE|nr:hypothetical protein QFC20_003671 [Naganishia adeliensis]